MSFYRTVLAAVAAIAIAAPVFADDTSTTTTTTETTSATDASSTDQSAVVRINLNTASAKDLLKVKGLNASKAKAIIAFRKKNGEFKATSDIANVKGFKKMSPEKLQAIEDQLTVE